MLKISPHHHSGRHLPHAHTSYPSLAIILLLTALLLVGSTWAAFADDNIAVTATVTGNPPTDPAIITDPVDQQKFTTTPITVYGTCPGGYLVKITRNAAFAGSTVCQSSDTFSIEISLEVGANSLAARAYNYADQPGPESPAITVYYLPPSPPTPPVASGSATPVKPVPPTTPAPLRLTSDQAYRGLFPGQPYIWSITVGGGSRPYALHWDWGDGHEELLSLNQAGKLERSHVYEKIGRYLVKIKVTDSEGYTAILQLVALVNPSDTTGNVGATPLDGGLPTLSLTWPLYIVILTLALSYWLGEKHEDGLWRRRFSHRRTGSKTA